MKNNQNYAVRAFAAIVRALFSQIGLVEPSACRFGDGDDGHLAGIIDRRNGIIDIAKGADHVIFKFPIKIKVGCIHWNKSKISDSQLFQQLGIELNLQHAIGKHQILAEYDLNNGIIIARRGDQCLAFTIPRGTPVDIYRYTYHKQREQSSLNL